MAEPALGDIRLSPLGDCVLLVELGSDASEATALKVRAVAEDLLARPLHGLRDVVAAVCTVALHYDPQAVDPTSAMLTPYEALAQQVRARLATIDPEAAPPPGEFEIPVCYGGELGEDLDALAQAHDLSADEVIALHSAVSYRVQMLGFAPGFAYLAGLDPRIATPRRRSPRTRVPAGSVAIGGELTGIYPLDLPGGWHVIGRSPLRFFDPAAARPSLLIAGDRVRFKPIGAQDYQRLQPDVVLPESPVWR
jgi:inhibitor of KinA